MPRPSEAPFLGVGVGLRPKHYPRILETLDSAQLGIDFFEAISENYMVPGGRPPRVLERVRERFPIVLHGVSLNVGSADPLDAGYLAELAALARRFEPAWISDHLCWTGVGGHNLHDLLPLPYTEAVIGHVAERVMRVQDRLGRRIALENVSSYFAYCSDAMPEWKFLVRIAERADCGILLDVNNIFVSAHNHGFDPQRYLSAIPPERVFQIHLAGHSEHGSLLIDTHDHPVRSEVWNLYEAAIRRLGPVSTLIEWDDH
ncbi:MAG: MNIO family bufferin maturase, partial [Myxococcota bacterium]